MKVLGLKIKTASVNVEFEMFLGVGTEKEYLGWKMKSTLCIKKQISEILNILQRLG